MTVAGAIEIAGGPAMTAAGAIGIAGGSAMTAAGAIGIADQARNDGRRCNWDCGSSPQ